MHLATLATHALPNLVDGLVAAPEKIEGAATDWSTKLGKKLFAKVAAGLEWIAPGTRPSRLLWFNGFRQGLGQGANMV